MMKNIIFETDFCTDVDDVGALVLLAEAARVGKIRLVGVSVNVPGSDKAPAVLALLERYGLGQVPVGVWKGFPLASGSKSEYTPYLADQCSMAGKVKNVPDTAELYRALLADAEDGSLEIVSVGFFTAMAHAIAQMPELFNRKVRRVTCMAGSFDPEAPQREFNVEQDAESAKRFTEAYHGELLFLPFETGAPVMTDLHNAPEGSLTKECYRLYTKGTCVRNSWDPLTADVVISGAEDRFCLSAPGRISVTADGYTCFVPDETGNCRWVMPAQTPETLGDYITNRIMQDMR